MEVCAHLVRGRAILREHDEGLRAAVLVLDVVVSALAFVGILALADPCGAAVLTRAGSVKVIALGLVASLVWPIALQSTVVQRATRQLSIKTLLAQLSLTGAISATVVAATAFQLRAPIPPTTLLSCVLAQLIGVGLYRIAILLALRLVRCSGRNFRNLLIVGSGPRAQDVQRRVQRHPEWGYRTVGFVDDGAESAHPSIPPEQVHKFIELPQLIRDETIDQVIVACPRSVFPKLGPIVAVCAESGVPVTLLSDIFGDYLPAPQMTRFDAVAALRFSPVHHSRTKLLVKRLIDIVGASGMILIASPLITAAAAAIKLTSRGPVFFHQIRCARNGHCFEMLKLRTMVPDAEAQKAALRDLNEMDGPVFKIRNDPRVTRVGHFLRRWSIDELPQLWNVLRGDMSLVGPRPPTPQEVARYRIFERRRLSMRPGLTCLWQVNGRNRINFADWVKLDLEYIDTWSLTLDVKILLRTIPAVLLGTGS